SPPLLPLSQPSKNRVELLSSDSPLRNATGKSNRGENLLSTRAECRALLCTAKHPDSLSRWNSASSRSALQTQQHRALGDLTLSRWPLFPPPQRCKPLPLFSRP